MLVPKDVGVIVVIKTSLHGGGFEDEVTPTEV